MYPLKTSPVGLCSTRALPPRFHSAPGNCLRLSSRRKSGSLHLPLSLSRLCRGPLRVQAFSWNGKDWTPPKNLQPVLDDVYKRVQPVADSLVIALQVVIKYQQQWVKKAWARAIIAWAVVLGIGTALVNVWGVPALNRRLPQLAQQATAILHRDVQIGRVQWLAPTGITGLHPLGCIGPVSIGSGPVERSNATLDHVTFSFNPVHSLLRGRLVLTVKGAGAQIHLKQGDNFSWFGFPDDTNPTSRDFLPGLATVGTDRSKDQGRGGDSHENENNRPPASPRGSSSTTAAAATTTNHIKIRRLPDRNSNAVHSSTRSNPSQGPGQPMASIVNEFLSRDQIRAEALGHDYKSTDKNTPLLASTILSAASEPSPALPTGDEIMGTDGVPPHDNDKDPIKRDKKKKGWINLSLPFSNPFKSSRLHDNDVGGGLQNVTTNSDDGKAMKRHKIDALNSIRTLSVDKITDGANPNTENDNETPNMNESTDNVVDIATDSSMPDSTSTGIITQDVYSSSVHSISDDYSTAAPAPVMPNTKAVSILNQMPSLKIDIRSKSKPKISSKPPLVSNVVESSAAKSINALQPLKTTSAEASPIMKNSHRLASFRETVVDQATERRKGLGSKALQQARNWQPARPLLHEPSSSFTREKNDDTLQSRFGAEPVVGLHKDDRDLELTGSNDGAYQPIVQVHSDSEETNKLDKTHVTHHHHHHKGSSITHPGYFPTSSGPVYTPAPPEALAGLRAKQRSLGSVFIQIAGAVGALVQRSLVVSSLELQGGTLYGHIHGEEIPRVFENVSASVLIGPKYDTLDVDIKALPQARDPQSQKCTMPNPQAHRHLRDYTGKVALERQAENNADNIVESSTAAETDTSPSRNTLGSGGKVRVFVNATGLADNDLSVGGPRVPDMTITVRGENLHAPLVERIFELPMDINDGRANGEFIIKMHDWESWHTPEYYGKVAVRGANFHFWDATDDIMDADLDLFFEGDRLYLHKAKGRFGDVPMTLTGDLDLNPITGQYRLSASVPGVEINSLRATLGVRPTPFPVTGSVYGTLHVTGPLEKPIFSGIARVSRPNSDMLTNCETTNALSALLSEPSAVGAYDKIPLLQAELVFSLDTATERMTLHEFKAQPMGGGELHGYGSLGVSPASETDPNALDVTIQGSGVSTEYLARRYLPEGAQLPAGFALGPVSLNGTLRGAHLSPVIDVAYSMPQGLMNGSIQFTRDATSVSIASPNLDGSGTVFLNPPSFDAIKAALTQERATALARPDISGCNADVTMRGVDVVQLLSDEESLRRLAQQSGQPLRLKVNGRAKISGKVEKVNGTRNSNQQVETSSNTFTTPWQFAGSLDLEDFRLNQLKLYRALKGSMDLSDQKISIHAKGLRPDEALDIDLALPLLQELAGNHTSTIPTSTATERDVDGADNDQGSIKKEGEEVSVVPVISGSSVSLRCGQLIASATVNAAGSQVDMRVANVKLDELELASLRGELQEISCALNFQGQTGRGKLSLVSPRYSGLRGESLSGGFRWERDVIRLEKLVLQQRRSKYEVQGEYVVPPTVPLPTSAADLARRQAEQRRIASLRTSERQEGDTQSLQVPGRWRLRVDVPTADMQEILPVARLLQNAASRRPADYERAKSAFIDTVRKLTLKADDLNGQLRELAERLADVQTASFTVPQPPQAPVFQLPSFQDVHGHWSGSVQAFGGGGGATSCEFDVRGDDWQWGQASLDALVADGSYHSEEGVQLQEFVLKSGDAKLLVRGSLLNDHQDATVLITDFPMAKLRPIFRAIPALKNAAPAVSGKVPDPIPSPLPLGILANVLGQASQGLHEGPPSIDADSPINGLLYVSGALSGSKDAPVGEVAVRLYDAAVGPTRLAQAQASARLSENMQLTFNVDIVPVEGHRKSGHVRAAGSIPLAERTSSSHSSDPIEALGDGLLEIDSSSGGEEMVSVGDKSGGISRKKIINDADPGPLDLRLSVRDSGMAVLTSIAPDFKWRSGEADVTFRFTGTLDKPAVTGSAVISKALIECPVLKFPLEILSADIHCEDGMAEVEAVDVRVGRRGHIKARGALPLYQSKVPVRGAAPVLAAMQNRLTVDIQGLELRVRNIYTGQMDALLTLRDSVEHPVMGGSLRFSRGAVYIIPQGQDAPNSAGTSIPTTSSSTSGLIPASQPPSSLSVAKLFELLTRRESGLAARLEDAVRQEVEAVEHMVEDAAGPNLTLDGLALQFGPDLRAVYPLVMNFGVSGELITSGPAHPDTVSVEGVLKLPGGDVNLVAAQLELDREHANTLTFTSSPGIDPFIDVVFTSGDLRLSVRGKSSEWADHLVMQTVGGASAGGDAGEQLDAAEAARLLEAKLKAALLADDGQLALSRLAGTTVSTLMPKIETQGTVGGARWRLVSAPAIPGLLDPLMTNPSNLLGSITMGTEVEVQFGRKLQANMVRKLRDSDVNTQWTLNYLLNSKLRMQFNISSAPPYSKTLMFQYSSEGS